MSHLDHILCYVLYTQLMAGVNTWDLYLLAVYKSGFVGPYHIEDMIVRNIQHLAKHLGVGGEERVII